MTFVGHSIVGLSVAAGAVDANRRPFFYSAAAIFVLFANFPDFAFRIIPYFESHSLITVLVILAAGNLLVWFFRSRIPGLDWKLILLGNLTVLSHFLLDTFYNHGTGLMLFWPVSAARSALPVPWLSVMQPPFFPVTEAHLKVFLMELVTFGPLLVLVILGKMIGKRRKESAE